MQRNTFQRTSWQAYSWVTCKNTTVLTDGSKGRQNVFFAVSSEQFNMSKKRSVNTHQLCSKCIPGENVLLIVVIEHSVFYSALEENVNAFHIIHRCRYLFFSPKYTITSFAIVSNVWMKCMLFSCAVVLSITKVVYIYICSIHSRRHESYLIMLW